MCAGAGQRQHQNIILYAVDKQPVRENMTFPMACPIAGQVMVAVLIAILNTACPLRTAVPSTNGKLPNEITPGTVATITDSY